MSVDKRGFLYYSLYNRQGGGLRKLILFIITLMTMMPILGIDYHLMRDDSTGAYWYWYEQNNNTVKYWAVHYYTSDTCTLRTIDWGRWTKAGKAYNDSIIVCFDNGGFPAIDSAVYRAVQTVNTGGTASVERHTVSGSPLAWGDFWIVISTETQKNNSYFLSDTMGSGYSYVSGDGITWNELDDGTDNADAIIRAWVSGPAGMSLLINENNEAPEHEYKDRLSLPQIISSRNSSFSLQISSPSYIDAFLADRTGRIIEHFHRGYMDPGLYDFPITGSIGSGIYFIVINCNGNVVSRKLLNF